MHTSNPSSIPSFRQPDFKKSFLLVVCVFIHYSTGLQAHQSDTTGYDYDKVVAALDLQPGHWMADIGSRDGSYFNHFLPILGESGHIFAVDIDPDGIEALHENMNQWPYSNISTIYSMQTNPMLPAGSLDVIFMRNTYHEFNDPELMLSHFKKALKPGGRIVISDMRYTRRNNHNRSTQERNHALDIEFAISDLEESGFTIVSSDPNFATSQYNRTHWLITAIPSVHQ